MDPDWDVQNEVDISPAFYSVGDYKRWFEHIEETNANIITMKWIEFVKHAKENYPVDDDDDFSE